MLTLNIGGPSPERAQRQLAWLAQRPEDVLILTETTPSRGCDLLAERFEGAGYEVVYPAPERGERGVLIVSRLPISAGGTLETGYLPYRAVRVAVKAHDGPLDIVGLYVPSRDASAPKVERKRRFLEEVQKALPGGGTPSRRVVIGDFNVLEPGHVPRYSAFRAFEYGFYQWFDSVGYLDAFRELHPSTHEYSWVGRTGDGYRYDHAFVSGSLRAAVHSCAYVHEPRHCTEPRLSDHSGLSLRLAVNPVEALPVSDPINIRAQEPPALF
ncbi:endonuclease/exonuclease/phosphatase family protein [Streptomyces sp. UNOC14_S4]|nr:endonuclease/exonuclease/phosphatase family protein [Streptomyces sp. UNOC14_S4]